MATFNERKIKWSETALSSQIEIIDFLLYQWGVKYVINYRDLTKAILATILQHPERYLVVNKKAKIHRALIHKNVSLYYQIKSDTEVVLLAFWANRKNPSDLQSIIDKQL